MLSRNLPASMDQTAINMIDARLADIRHEHAVAIPLAIESGSRAWGFPSPDSDYDCRFIFVRSTNDYLSLFPFRDVIETPLEGDLDVNGWDVRKALKLLLKGNAVVIEWLTSPIVYSADEWFRDAFLTLARSVADRERVARHYLHLGERQRRTYFADGKPMQLKKLFYALRPAAALRWLRLHPSQAVAPMNFQALIAQCDMPTDIAVIIDDLIERKSVTRELGSGMLPSAIASFIDTEFSVASDLFGASANAPPASARAKAEEFYREVLSRFGGAPK